MTTKRFKVMAVTILGLTAPACGSSTETGSTSPSEVASVSTTILTASTTAAAAAVTTSTVATTSATPSTTTPPTTQPVVFPTFAEAVVARLSDELGDPGLAAELVTRLGPETLSQFEAAIGNAGAADSLLLSIAPPTVDASEVDSIVVYAFGNRVAADGALTPGPMNEDLAAATMSFVAEHPVPVYAQWEVADLLVAAGMANVASIGREVDASGNVTYLSTAGVAAKALELANAAGSDLGQVGVIGFADHAVRCVLTSTAAGMTAAVPDGLLLPSVYDAESGQPWTRNRLDYLSVDVPARLAVRPPSGT